MIEVSQEKIRRLRIAMILLAGAFVFACSQGGGNSAQGALTGSGGSNGPNVLESHGDSARAGLLVRPELTAGSIPNLTLDTNFQGSVSGNVYAQPLYVENGGRKMIFVATESNQVAALDADNGAVIWKVAVGTPVPVSKLPCGNIDPLGITGTPVIDPATQSVFFDAMTTPDGGATKKHFIYSLSLSNGAPRPGWPVEVAGVATANGNTFDPEFQNQRTALTLLNNRVFAGYGGHDGDCGDYHGWIVGVDTNQPGGSASWSTRTLKGGVWAPGGLPTDGSSIYFSSGNTDDTSDVYGDGNGVFKLDSNLKQLDFFAPADWRALDDADADLGGTNPILINVGGRNFALALGKDGNAYLLNRGHLGGISAPLNKVQVSSSSIITEPAAFNAADGTYVVFRSSSPACPDGQSGDLAAIKIKSGSPPNMQVAWCAALNGRGSPVVTTPDGTHDFVIWAVGSENDQKLHAFDGLTGREIWSSSAMSQAVMRFQVPLIANGHVYVAATDKVYSFKK
jgi:hypothetical protein